MANTCCPPGYDYDSGRGLCTNRTSPAIEPISCACCPTGYTILDSTGGFFNPVTGAYTHITNPNITPYLGICVQVENYYPGVAPWAIAPPEPVDPVGCPCCPDGYTYNSISADCVSRKGEHVPTTICLDCSCVTVEPPPCPSCTTAGEGISFSWDFTTRQCINCPPVEPIAIPCNLQNFMPIQFADPITTFKLLSLNYM